MTTLLSNLGIPESPRWHDDRLWFCNWVANQITAVDEAGNTTSIDSPSEFLMGYSIDWLPDGTLLVTGDKLRRVNRDGSVDVLADQRANEIVVDRRGFIYLNGADFDFRGGETPKPGYIKLLTPDGNLATVAEDIQFPNGMVITPDDKTLVISESFAGRLTAFDIEADGSLTHRRTFADGLGPDGIGLDAEGAVWTSTGDFAVVRVADGGEVLQRIELDEDRAPFAVTLGGADGRTLFILTAEWRMADGMANLERLAGDTRTGEIHTTRVDVPRAQR